MSLLLVCSGRPRSRWTSDVCQTLSELSSSGGPRKNPETGNTKHLYVAVCSVSVKNIDSRSEEEEEEFGRDRGNMSFSCHSLLTEDHTDSDGILEILYINLS